MSQRKNKDRKEQLLNFKSKHKRQKMEDTAQNQLQDNLQTGQVRQFPVWNNDEKLELYGKEWEEIFNFINGVQSAFMACSSVMNRNVLNGKIRMRFEKIDPATGQYVAMSPEEEAPYQKQFTETVQKAKELAAEAVKRANEEANSQEGVPYLDALVDQNGETLTKDENKDKPKLTIVE